MDALRKARLSSWHHEGDTVLVKLVVCDVHFPGPVLEPVGRLLAQTTITVRR